MIVLEITSFNKTFIRINLYFSERSRLVFLKIYGYFHIFYVGSCDTKLLRIGNLSLTRYSFLKLVIDENIWIFPHLFVGSCSISVITTHAHIIRYCVLTAIQRY